MQKSISELRDLTGKQITKLIGVQVITTNDIPVGAIMSFSKWREISEVLIGAVGRGLYAAMRDGVESEAPE